MGAFSFNLGMANSLSAELNGAMIAIEMASQKGWNHLRIETDSMLVTLAFKCKSIVP
jgi:ribonuclease HI